MKYLIILILFLSACDNARHRINVNTNPFSTKFEEKTKVGYFVFLDLTPTFASILIINPQKFSIL